MYSSSGSDFSFHGSFPNTLQLHHLDDAESLAFQDPDTVLSALQTNPCHTVDDGEADDAQAIITYINKVHKTEDPLVVIACQKSTSDTESYKPWSSLVSRLMAAKQGSTMIGQNDKNITAAEDQSWAIIKGGPLDHQGDGKLALTQEAVERASSFLQKPFVIRNNTSACFLSELPDETLKQCKGIIYTCTNAVTEDGITGAWNAQADKDAYLKLLDRTKSLGIPVILSRTNFINVKANHQGQLSDASGLLTMGLHPDDHAHFVGVMHKTMPESLTQSARALQYINNMTQEEIVNYMSTLCKQARSQVDTNLLSDHEKEVFESLVSTFETDATKAKRYRPNKHGHVKVIKSNYDKWVMDNPINDSLGDAAGLSLLLQETKDQIQLHPVHVNDDLSLVNSADPANNVYLAVAHGASMDKDFVDVQPQRVPIYSKLAEQIDGPLKTIMGPGTAQAWKVYSTVTTRIMKECRDSLEGKTEFKSLTAPQVTAALNNYKLGVKHLESGHMTKASKGEHAEQKWEW